LALTTDIITGFPGETEKNHKETCDFIKGIPFARFHIFKYSDRYVTKASTLENKVSADEIKNRSKNLFEIDYKKRKDFLNKNMGLKRKAVKIGKYKALTDNYITTKLYEGLSRKADRAVSGTVPDWKGINKIIDKEQNGIFEVEITKSSTI
jgi:threonylcarbamoyladenosine tRNA methylthiotransferase MtaB